MGHGEKMSMGHGRTWAQDGFFLIDQEMVEELRILTFQQMEWRANGECFQLSLHAMHIEHPM